MMSSRTTCSVVEPDKFPPSVACNVRWYSACCSRSNRLLFLTVTVPVSGSTAKMSALCSVARGSKQKYGIPPSVRISYKP